MKSIIAIIWSFAAVAISTAAPPQRFTDELRNPPIRIINRSTNMPPQLVSALVTLFGEPQLSLAEPGRPMRPEFIINGKSRELPDKRFLFAFETRTYFCVYIERGAPTVCAYAIVFRKDAPHKLRFVWAGGDLEPPFAKNVNELKRRVQAHDLLDHDPTVW